ncbi:MAG: MFS transporter, partial [Firmicutes bacterium]|nr:MFS transporter [Bacillota bacterium]
AKQDYNGAYYVVDSGHSRLLCFDKNSDIHTVLLPTDTEGSNLYIDDFTAENGCVYLSASVWDGMMLKKEIIAEFRGEKYIRTVTERDYSNALVNKHRFYGICIQNDTLSYAECEENAIIVHHISLTDGKETTHKLSFKNAFNAVSDCAFSKDILYILDKTGTITAVKDNKQTVFYSTKWKGEKERIPYRLAVSPKGEVGFTDIRNNQAVQVDFDTQTTQVLLSETFSQTINFTKDGSGIMYLEDSGLQVKYGSRTESYSILSKNTKQIVRQALWFIDALLLAVAAAILLFRLLFILSKRKYTASQALSLWVIGAVATASIVISGMMLRNFSEIYREKYMKQIENSALIMANQIPEGILSKINLAEDFDNEAYRSLCSIMEGVFPADVDFNKQLYCNILKLSEDGETAFAVAYLDQSIGTYFPLDEIDTAEVIQAYQPENKGKVIWNDGVEDISGAYISVKVPIYQEGKVVGVVMVGSETYVIRDIITKMQIRIVFSIIVILMLIWLAISETMAWVGNKERYKARVDSGDTASMPGHLIRLLIFAVFACYNMATAFLPIWVLKNSNIFSGASRDFMASLPLTINIFVIGIMSLFTAAAVRKLSIKRILTISTACSFCGNLIMFLFPSYVTVFIGLFIDGIGVGLITNAIYILLTYIKNEDDQQFGLTLYNKAYLSGINFGMLSGSALAVLLGQRTVFAVIALIWLGLMLVGTLLVNELQGLLSYDNNSESTQESIPVGRFLINKSVMSFIVLIQNPYIIFNSFVFYYVTIFCEKMGYVEVIASLMIMLYSEVAVIMGNILTKNMSKLFGSYGMYMAYITNIAALMLFAFTQNTVGLVLALLLMGTAAAYGKPLQQTWFLKLKQTRQFGEDNAMGVYNFSENIGESLGPVVFSSLMSYSPLFNAISVFCGAVFAAGCGHLLINRKELKNSNKQIQESEII